MEQVTLSAEAQKAVAEKDAAWIIRNPEEFGFRWATGELNRGIGDKAQVIRKEWSYVKITDVEKFGVAFGWTGIRESLNGTSYKVKCQNVCRDWLEANPKATDDMGKLRQVNHVLLGVISREAGVVTSGLRDKIAQLEAENAKLKAGPTRVEQAQDMLAKLVDAGISVEQARVSVNAMFPDVG